MKYRSASLVELHAFLAVCRRGTMRQAAEELCVTQAAVSRAVLRLEQRLGCSLFERGAQGVVPNAQARALRARIEPGVLQLEQAFIDFRRAPGLRHALRVSVVPTLATRWLMPRLKRFHAAHPEIDVELRQYRHNEDFQRDDVDVWIELKRPGLRWPRNVAARYLIGREITPVCTPQIAARLKTPADLLQQVLLHHTNFPDNWRLWLDAAGVSVPRLKLGSGFDLSNNMIVAARDGMGAAILQPCLVEAELASGELVQPFERCVSTGRGYYLCSHRARDDNRAVDAFRQWIFEMAGAGLKR
jgi:LysR family glycine cleavage system transcriptional activator